MVSGEVDGEAVVMGVAKIDVTCSLNPSLNSFIFPSSSLPSTSSS